MDIKLMISVPEPQVTEKAKPAPKLSPEEKVKHYIELIESGYKSDVEWLILNKIYKQLCGMKQNPRITNIISMIKPVLAKYGYHGVPAETK